MEVNQQSMAALGGLLQKTLTPKPQERQEAEKSLRKLEAQANFSRLLVMIMDSDQVPMLVRQAGAIYFKNFIMRNWVPDNPDQDVISQQDRTVIKRNLAELMLKSPKLVQTQLSHALAIVSRADFPKNWPELLPQLVGKMGEENFGVINGVLETAHSIFYRYRVDTVDEDMVEELTYVLKHFCPPLLSLFERVVQLVPQCIQNGNKAMLEQLLNVLHMIIELVYDLNAPEHPEFFADSLPQWMGAFGKLLKMDQQAVEFKADDEPGPVENVKQAICNVVLLFVSKYESDFEQYMGPFVQLICTLITNLDDKERYDQLVATAIKCLTHAVPKAATREFFAKTLDLICTKIIVPQIRLRESDIEMFEMNGLEYVRRDMEGSDVDTRRRTVVEFIRALCEVFPEQVTKNLQNYVGLLLKQSAENPEKNWMQKDAALYIFLALSVQGSTREKGATKINPLLDIGQFLPQHVLSELSQGPLDQRPVLKAGCLKFLSTFRSFLPKQDVATKYLPLVIRYLTVEEFPVHTYAAIAIDQLLALTVEARDEAGKKQNLVRPEQVQVLVKDFSLLNNIFGALQHSESSENPWIMKAVLRVCATGKQQMAAYDAAFMGKLAAILKTVVANPQNPEFSHYLFETYACLIKYLCREDPSRVEKFEAALFGPFQQLLTPQDAQGNRNPFYCEDFHTYVFQILAQTLEIRKDLSKPYQQIFPGLLAPAMYESDGNVPGMVRLLRLALRKDAKFCIGDQNSNRLSGILGVFKFLNSSKKHDNFGIDLLTDILLSVPKERLEPFIPNIFSLVLGRLTQGRRTPKYVDHILAALSMTIVHHGFGTLVQWINRCGQGEVFEGVLTRVWLPNLRMVAAPVNRKKVAVGMAHMLCKSPQMLQPPYAQHWAPTLQALLEFLEKRALGGDDSEDLLDLSEQGFKTVYAPLVFAKGVNLDPFLNVPEPRHFLAKSLGELDQQFPGKVTPMLRQLSEPAQQALRQYLQQANVRLS